jgi:ubiquinone/menaquinone biosynthesis C-methylase UbiE
MAWRRDESLPELIDVPPVAEAALARNLREQAWCNRWLGGYRPTLAHALPFLRRCPSRPLRVLEAGCGGADLACLVAAWARASGLPITVTALDRNPQVVACAAAWCQGYLDVTVMQGDACRLPFPANTFDLVLLPNLLHHLPDSDAIAALREAARVSRGRVVATDVLRSPLAYAAIRVLTTLPVFGAVTAHDGPLSVRRAFTPSEFRTLAAAAGLDDARLYGYPFWRMALVYR